MSERWVEDFLPVAREQRPPPQGNMIEGVVVKTFDNLSMDVDYKSYSSDGKTGEKVHMTNWFSVKIPRDLAPHFNTRATGAASFSYLIKPFG